MRAIFTVVGAVLFLVVFGAIVALMMALFSNYMNTMQTVQQQQQQLSKLQQQLQQGLVGWINTSATDTSEAEINATIYNVGLLVVNLTSILVVWPNNTATPIENLTYTTSFTPPACGSSDIIDGKLTIELQPACRADINIKASVDSETAKYINLTRIIAIGYTFTAGPLTPTPASTTLQLQHYKLTKTTTPTPTTTTPTPKLQLAKRHAIAWDTFDTNPFTEEKLYVLVRTRGTSYDWSNGKIWLNTTASTYINAILYYSYNVNENSNYSILSVAINLSRYNSAYPEINETIADKIYVIANVTMLNSRDITLVYVDGYGEVDTEEYLVFPNTTSPSSNYYALGGWNHTDTERGTYEELAILAVLPDQGYADIINRRQLPSTLLTNRTATLEALYDTQNISYPLLVCVLINQTYRECLSSGDEYNIFPATAGFQSSTWAYVSVNEFRRLDGYISAEGYTNVSVDWFVLSLNATPEYINVTGLDAGWSVELYDGGQLVASAVAGGDGVARLFVAFHSIVVEPRVVIRDSDGNLIADIGLDEVMVGGDVWMFSLS